MLKWQPGPFSFPIVVSPIFIHLLPRRFYGDSNVIDGESKATDSIISPSLLHPSPPRCSAISFVKAFGGFFPDSNLQPPSSPTKSASKVEAGCRRGADMRALRRQRFYPTSAFARRRGADHCVYHLLLLPFYFFF
ncbi:Hypothetical predicted protein [Olea europaea subsp. europaea]|uniref:Uncharacterized protein n=1 Tax=Olea europaea subsp. europaea TaxID=158383 RepID=A0A8S0SE12_OLEEU|nr:Hypothetical predicted protein [Olea europaea subsp. europaea]